MEYLSSSGFQSGRHKTPKHIPYTMAPATSECEPHSAGTQKGGE